MFHQFMGTKDAIQKFRNEQKREMRWLLDATVRDPKNVLENIRKWALP